MTQARKQILVLQSRLSPEWQVAEQKNLRVAAGDLAELSFVSTFDVEQGWETPAALVREYDAIIICGSSDLFLHGGMEETDTCRVDAHDVLARVRTLVEYLIERQVPTLGICFGHHLMAEVFGGQVTHDHAQKKAGTHYVRLTEEGTRDPIFAGFSPGFEAQYAHRDSVTRPPMGAVVLAEGEACHFAALRYGSACYSVQFHPELTADHLRALPEALKLYLPEGVAPESVIRESRAISGLLQVFLDSIGSKVLCAPGKA